MSKQKVRLDRKTRRALQSALRSQPRPPREEAADQSYFSVGANGFVTGVSKKASATKAMRAQQASTGSASSDEATELPPIDGDLYVSRYRIEDHYFTNRVARHFLGDLPHTTARRQAPGNTYSRDQIAFYDTATRDRYETWMAEYLARFSGHEDLDLPAPIDGHYPYVVRANFNRPTKINLNSLTTSTNSGDDQRLEQWLWILDNLHGEVRHAGVFWFFADEGDATLFRLAFP